jgi:hypothetical protein
MAGKDADELQPDVADELRSDEVTVHCIAVGEDDEEEIVSEYRENANTPFQVVMDEWCKRYGVTLDAAEFELDTGGFLRPEETPRSRGWTPASGALRIYVKPARILVRVIAEVGGLQVRTDIKISPEDCLSN